MKISNEQQRKLVRVMLDGADGHKRVANQAAIAFNFDGKNAVKSIRDIVPEDDMPDIVYNMLDFCPNGFGLINWFKKIEKHFPIDLSRGEARAIAEQKKAMKKNGEA